MPTGEAAQPCRLGVAMTGITGMYRVPERVIASRLDQPDAQAWLPRSWLPARCARRRRCRASRNRVP
jgi:hypothetical protein